MYKSQQSTNNTPRRHTVRKDVSFFRILLIHYVFIHRMLHMNSLIKFTNIRYNRFHKGITCLLSPYRHIQNQRMTQFIRYRSRRRLRRSFKDPSLISKHKSINRNCSTNIRVLCTNSLLLNRYQRILRKNGRNLISHIRLRTIRPYTRSQMMSLFRFNTFRSNTISLFRRILHKRTIRMYTRKIIKRNISSFTYT